MAESEIRRQAHSPLRDILQGVLLGRGRRPPLLLTTASIIAAAFFAVPFVYLLVRNVTEDSALPGALWSGDTIGPLVRTLWLAITVAASAASIGTLLAWLTVRTDLPLRRLWLLLSPLPLVLPSFVAGAALLAAFAPGGLLDEALSPLGVTSLPLIDGYWGAWAVLTLISYPYVYLPTAARLAALPPEFEEAARLLGHRGVSAFRYVVWPQIAGAVRAGTLLVFLYVVSDFGVVQLMGYSTLSTRIFASRLLDPSLSFALGIVLGVVALTLVAIERSTTRERPLSPSTAGHRPVIVSLRRWKIPALTAVGTTVGIGLLAPITVLSWWVYRGTLNNATGFASLGDGFGGLAGPTINTVITGIVAAIAAVVVVLPVAYLTGRYRTRLAAPLNAVLVAGFALPGLVIALSVVFLALEVPLFGVLYLTFPLLIMAYVIHFGAQAFRSAQVGVASIDNRLDEAGRTLGVGRLRRLWRVELPLMLPALAAGAGLVMLSTMKELPATLLASPIGFETLATRIWNANADGFLGDAGLASLVLIAISALLTWAVILRRAQHLQ